jgi:hypothetical protein
MSLCKAATLQEQLNEGLAQLPKRLHHGGDKDVPANLCGTHSVSANVSIDRHRLSVSCTSMMHGAIWIGVWPLNK